MSMIESLIRYVGSCPLLNTKGKVYADMTPAETDSLSVAAASTKLLKRYLDKSCLWEANYILFVRVGMDEDKQRLNHNAFLEALCNWLETQNRNKNLPQMGANLKPLAIEGANPMVNSVEPNGIGIYQLQIKLTYYAMTR